MSLIKNNWKGILFPIVCIGIILSDQLVFGLPWTITLVKLLIFSLLHVLFVLKTKYVYDSDIYKYVALLRIEIEKNHVIKPFLTRKQATFIWWFFFVLINLYLLRVTFIVQNLVFIHGLLFILGSIIFLDSFNEIFRMLTNKADLGRVYVPHSLQQTRGVIRFGTKLIPTCISVGKGIMTAAAGSELLYPQVCGNIETIGPLTKWGMNQVYSDSSVPLTTRSDVIYESYKAGYNAEVDQGLRPESSRLPDRHVSIRSKDDLLSLGISKNQCEALSNPGFFASLPNKK